MFHWLHHLLNPHCSLCQDEKAEDKVCQSCETLKMQLSIANHEKQQMLNSILSMTQKPEVEESSKVDYEKLKPTMVTWRVRKQMLEAEDRERARLMAEQKKHKEEFIKNLEQELGVEEGVKSSA